MDEQSAQMWRTAVALLFNPYVIVGVFLVTALTAVVVWKHAENWQRAWMIFVLLVYIGWLVFVLLVA